MTTSYFYLQAEKNEINGEFIEIIKIFSEQNKKQVYIIDRPLGDNKYTYGYTNKIILLAPNHKIVLIDFNNNTLELENFTEDFIEDLGSISDKYRYKSIIGRPRQWRNELIAQATYEATPRDPNQFFLNYELRSAEDRKKCELLVSLLTGSINDIEKVKGSVPDNILDKIKQKIILFDGDQTRFIYQNPSKHRITIQGLSGTGKTELLLHKLKDIYTQKPDSKIIFTCHNKILADSLRQRIPTFFNFMKVEEQILWDCRLWCVIAWGSESNKNSGAYSYICNYYNIPFYRYSSTRSFDDVCKFAIKDLTDIDFEHSGYAFDYMLIDESQDFPKSFFALCELVTRNTIYIAGDIFQSIFDDTIVSEIDPDYLLSKCYRTDPKTLMFAHALGMGLFENPKLRWLEDKEWKACGYIVNKLDKNKQYELTREPLRRFEDLDREGINSIEIVKTSRDKGEDAEVKILQILQSIINTNPTVSPNDIGIIFIDNNKDTYLSADKLEQSIPREFGWKVNKAYETKASIKGALFVSNKNNVKGLEFPFVICVTKRIGISRSYRNSLYMMLTRSFIKSYLLTSLDINEGLLHSVEAGLREIVLNGRIIVSAPSDAEKQIITTTITYDDENISYYDFVYKIFEDLDIPSESRSKVHEAVKQIVGESFDYDNVAEVIEFVYNKMSK